MEKVVVYFSKTGSNRYLAGKMAEALNCRAVELEPRVPGFVLPATFTGISFGNRKPDLNPADYDQLILCGPLYMGRIAAPCSDFLRKYAGKIRKFDFITCCASTDEAKNDTFGYGRVFTKMREKYAGKCGRCEAFPIELVVPEDKRDDGQAMMNTRLSDANWNGAVSERFDSMLSEMAE